MPAPTTTSGCSAARRLPSCGRSVSLRHRPLQPAARSGRAGRRLRLRRVSQRLWHDPPGVRAAGALARLAAEHRRAGAGPDFRLGLVVAGDPADRWPPLASRALGGAAGALSRWTMIMRYVYALAPMGFGMWLAHYSFHFLTGGLTLVPVVSRSWPTWACTGAGAVGPGHARARRGFFHRGGHALPGRLTGAMVAASRSPAGGQTRRRRTAVRPGGGAALDGADRLLLAAGLWIMLQPMEMRGTLQMLTRMGG